MDKENQPTFPARSARGFFEIHVQGHLDSKWTDWLEGLEVELRDSGEMILFGAIVDQAALMGILNKLNRLNLTLISVREIDPAECCQKMNKTQEI
jgi:hypothetical protein